MVRKKLLVRRKAYRRKGYTRKGYTREAYTRVTKTGKRVRVKRARVGPTKVGPSRVKATTFKTKDTGAPGRTPKAKRWFAPMRVTGWRKVDAASVRRYRLLAATDKRLTMRARYVQAGRMANQLANVTTDRETERKARVDAAYFFGKVD